MGPTGNVTEFVVPNAQSTAGEIATGPDGNLWFSHVIPSKVYRVTPTGTFTEFAVGSDPEGLTAGPDGNVWFAERQNIGRITP